MESMKVDAREGISPSDAQAVKKIVEAVEP